MIGDWLLLVAGIVVGAGLLLRPPAFRGAVLLGFVALSAGMTSPILLRLGSWMLDAGAGEDAFIGAWNLWWTRLALESGRNPFFTDWLLAPDGTSLALHTHAVTYGVLTLPLQWLGLGTPSGLIVLYNLIVIASFTMCGYFTYRLALQQTGVHEAAVVAGAVLAFSAFRFANTVRLHVLAMEWLVLVLWASATLLKRPRPRQLWLLAGSFVLLACASLEYAAYATLAFVLLFVASLVRGGLRERVEGTRRAWLVTGIGVVAASIVVTAPLWLQLRDRLAQGRPTFDPAFAAHYSADVADWLLLNPRHPVWGAPFARLTASFHEGDGGFGVALGWSVIVLLVLGTIHVLRSRRGLRWVVGAVAFFLLSLGPQLHVFGSAVDLPMPQELIATIFPPAASSRTPLRYTAPALVFLAVTVAFAVAALARRFGRVRFPAISLGMILLESLVAPLAITPVVVPRIYSEVARRAGRAGAGSVLHLPAMTDRENLLYQTVHGQKQVESIASAIPLHSPLRETEQEQLVRDLLNKGFAARGTMQRLAGAQKTTVLQRVRSFLAKREIRWILLTGGDIPPDVMRAYRENLRHLAPKDEVVVDGDVLFEL